MPDFWDLPRKVRDKIYRMHLVHDEPITQDAHDKMCRDRKALGYRQKQMPIILRVSARADREAAPIYYGENHFILPSLSPDYLVWRGFPRHFRLVQKVTCDWSPYQSAVGNALEDLAKLRSLHELTIQVDEREMVRRALRRRDDRPQYTKDSAECSPQEQLALYQLKGFDRLLSLRGIPHVNFVQRTVGGEEEGGPIPGGILLTQIKPKITAPVVKGTKGKLNVKKTPPKANKKSQSACFDFLGLPAELRNVVYELVLGIDGPIHPSKKPPSTIARQGKNPGDVKGPETALCLLAVNKQIRDEAVGIYYANPLVFYYPSQFHAFAIDLGQLRRSVIRDITIHYDNVKRGDTDSADLTAPLLRDFTGLRNLQIIMFGTLSEKIRARSRWSTGWQMDHANPALIPGMRALYNLRNLQQIRIRDMRLEEMYETAKKDKEYPDFSAQSRSYHIVKLTAALKHFNQALLDAQKGRINGELLQDNKWHTWDDFPELPEEEESDEEGEADEYEDADEQQHVTEEVEADQGDRNNMSTGIGTGDAPVKGPRRSARLSAKAAEVTPAQQDDAEDMEVEVLDGGRGASPEL